VLKIIWGVKMKLKLFNNYFWAICLVFIVLSLILITGCGVKDGDKDTHYKPSEYKHNIAIDKASRAIDDVNREIISMGAETPADVVLNTYNDGIAKLNEQLTNVENTQKLLSEDKDLTNSELRNWGASYDDIIKALNNNIKEIERKKTNFLK
jgi:hypothetical protein